MRRHEGCACVRAAGQLCSFPETSFRELKGMSMGELIAEYCLGCLVEIVLECGWRCVVFLLLVAAGVPRHTGCALPAALFVKGWRS